MWYYWRRVNWKLDLRRFLTQYETVSIDRPVFFLGNQGDGLTFVSRTVRRHPDVVSVTGDYRYWTGADEIQNVMRTRLPESLVLPGKAEADRFDDRLSPPHSWSYASDALLEEYRRTKEDFDEKAAKEFRRSIQEVLRRHGGAEASRRRFVDKSQSFTVKMSFVDALLDGCEPHFILITRNPYATCYRAALGKAGDMARYSGHMELGDRFELCVQHWANAMRCVLEDSDGIRNFTVLRLEDFLHRPRESVRELCSAVELEFREDLVPSADQRLPFGTRYMDRWYPVRTNVNEPYLAEIPSVFVETIEARCGELAGRLGYEPPTGG